MTPAQKIVRWAFVRAKVILLRDDALAAAKRGQIDPELYDQSFPNPALRPPPPLPPRPIMVLPLSTRELRKLAAGFVYRRPS